MADAATEKKMTRYANYIGDRATSSKAGLFELLSRVDGSSLGEWPLSGKREVDEALSACNPTEKAVSVSLEQIELAWEALKLLGESSLVSEGKSSSLEGFDREGAHAWEAADFSSGTEHLRARLGSQDAAARSFLAGESFTTFGMGISAPGRDVPVVIACDWSYSAAEIFAMVSDSLFAGRSVVLLADRDLPMIAALVVEALLVLRLPAGSVQLLHGLEPGGWTRIAEGCAEKTISCTGRLGAKGRKALHGFAATSRELAQLLLILRSPEETRWNLPLELSGPTQASDLNRLGSAIQDAAARLAREAFSGTGGFGGLRHGAPLVAAIPRLYFSVFTEALIAELESAYGADAMQAVSGFESSTGATLAGRHQVLWRAGLDEGATLATGGDPRATPGGGVRLIPAVLVNLSSDSTLSNLGEPLGVLRLQRA
jgi:hypothetical protein